MDESAGLGLRGAELGPGRGLVGATFSSWAVLAQARPLSSPVWPAHQQCLRLEMQTLRLHPRPAESERTFHRTREMHKMGGLRSGALVKPGSLQGT